MRKNIASKKYDVLTFGDLCVDLVVSGQDVVPEFGQKEKLVENYSLEMGGSCSIFACQTAKLGLSTVVAGKVGSDRFGVLIRDTLEDAGVLTDHIVTGSNLKTGISIALSNIDDRAILTYSGTIDSLGLEDVDFELLKSVRHLHIGSFYLMKKLQPHYPQIVRVVKENGGTVSLDTNWDPEERWDGGILDILPHVDIIFPNENEAMAITKTSSTEEAIERLRKTIPIVAVKKGADGVVVYSGGSICHLPAIDVIKKDAVGAGDSFDGGFIYGYLAGKNIDECARIGCICGSLSTAYSGGTGGQPHHNEIARYL